jgi:predicted dehydrogenase
MAPHILIIGSGSVGKRHARNLAALGCTISCVDPREDRRAELAAETPVIGAFATVEEALKAGGLYGVVVASPTAFHPSNTIAALEAGLPVLLEKPVAKTFDEAWQMHEAQQRTGVPVLLGYTWRWWPPLRRVRALLEEKTVGALRHVQFHMSAHLADWHPWEPYQEFFMASAAQGGGALLDESHWIDLMLWLFEQPWKIMGRVEKISDLKIDTDDNVDVLAIYQGPGELNFRVSLHLDLYGRPHEKFIRFVGEHGTILWSADPNRIMVGFEAGQNWQEKTFSYERNDMFVEVAKEYLDVVAGKAEPSCTLLEGINVMHLIEMIRQSSAEDGRAMPVGFAAG